MYRAPTTAGGCTGPSGMQRTQKTRAAGYQPLRREEGFIARKRREAMRRRSSHPQARPSPGGEGEEEIGLLGSVP